MARPAQQDLPADICQLRVGAANAAAGRQEECRGLFERPGGTRTAGNEERKVGQVGASEQSQGGGGAAYDLDETRVAAQDENEVAWEARSYFTKQKLIATMCV